MTSLFSHLLLMHAMHSGKMDMPPFFSSWSITDTSILVNYTHMTLHVLTYFIILYHAYSADI